MFNQNHCVMSGSDTRLSRRIIRSSTRRRFAWRQDVCRNRREDMRSKKLRFELAQTVAVKTRVEQTSKAE